MGIVNSTSIAMGQVATLLEAGNTSPPTLAMAIQLLRRAEKMAEFVAEIADDPYHPDDDPHGFDWEDNGHATYSDWVKQAEGLLNA